MEIRIFDKVGSFAENKDKAREIREEEIEPALKDGKKVILNFEGVTLATQSFIHAMISEPIRSGGRAVLDRIMFKNCNETIRTLVSVVCDYMQDSLSLDNGET